MAYFNGFINICCVRDGVQSEECLLEALGLILSTVHMRHGDACLWSQQHPEVGVERLKVILSHILSSRPARGT